MGISSSKENNKYIGNIIKVSDLPDLEQRQIEKKLQKDKKSKRRLSLSIHSSSSSKSQTRAGRSSTIVSPSSSILGDDDFYFQQPYENQIQDDCDFTTSLHQLLITTKYLEEQQPNIVLPEVVFKKIISYAVGSTFPSKNFSSVSLVCRAWWRMSFQSVTNLYYHFPFIYEKESDIRRCKLMARWLAPTNHYDQKNQISAVSLGFGFDTSGMCLLFPHLLKCTTLKSLRVTFYQRQVSLERIKAICQLIMENNNIRRLDISHNVAPIQVARQLALVFHEASTNLREFVWKEASLQDQHLHMLLKGLVNSQVYHINFADNQIDGENEQRFAEILKLLSQPSRISSIDLSFNYFNLQAVERIIEACRKNQRIKRLKLTGNQLTEDETIDLKYNIEKYQSKNNSHLKIYL